MTEARYGHIIVSGTASRLCTVDGCERKYLARGYCGAHWMSWKRHGDPLAASPRTPTNGALCSIDNCGRPVKSKGLCQAHHLRSLRGKPIEGAIKATPPRGRSLAERFWALVEKTDGCWLYRGHIGRNGYATFAVETRGPLRRGVGRGAHRVAYELTVGPIPQGYDLDHLCRVRHCVNPAHLEPVTRQENIRRSLVAA